MLEGRESRRAQTTGGQARMNPFRAHGLRTVAGLVPAPGSASSRCSSSSGLYCLRCYLGFQNLQPLPLGTGLTPGFPPRTGLTALGLIRDASSVINKARALSPPIWETVLRSGKEICHPGPISLWSPTLYCTRSPVGKCQLAHAHPDILRTNSNFQNAYILNPINRRTNTS